VLGYLAVVVPFGARGTPVPQAAREALARPAPSLDPARMVPRDLRRLPGIGLRLSLAIDRAREAHDPRAGPLAWQDVHGIGPATEAKARAWFRERGRKAPVIVPGATPR